MILHRSMIMKRHTFKEWMSALRPWSFPASAMPIIVSLAFIFYKEAPINWLYGIWILITMILFHAAGNTWSDYSDFKKGVDREDTFGAKSMTSGMFEPQEIKRLAAALLAVACLSGIGIFLCTGLVTLWCGLAGVVLVLLYPYLKYHALGDLVIVLTFAFIPAVGTSYVVSGAIDWNVLLVALPVGMITDGILHSNNTRDILHDRRAGISTLAMNIGLERAAGMYAFELMFPYIWIGILSMTGVLPIHTIIIFLTIAVALGCAKTMANAAKGSYHLLADLDVRTSNLQLMFSFLLSVAFVAARFI